MTKLRFIISITLFTCLTVCAEIQNGDFETSFFSPWTVVNGNGAWGNVPTNGSSGSIVGWQGVYYAQSAGSGSWNENTTGTLRSVVFTYPADSKIYYSHGGWSQPGGGVGSDYNYVALKLTNGTELARVYASGSLTMSQTNISSAAAYGKECYLEAIDNRAGSWGWFVVDDFRIAFPGDNLDFELGTWEDWTVSDSAFGSTPASSGDHSTVSGWHGNFYADSYIGGENAIGTLTSKTFVFTGILDFLIGGHSRGRDGTRTLTNYVALCRAADDTEIARVEAPGSDIFSSGSIINFSEINEPVYIKIVDSDDESQGGGWAWISADNFRSPKVSGNFKSIKFSGSDNTTNYIIGKPFYLLPENKSAFLEGTDVEIPCNFSAKNIFLLGMVNSVDRGEPIWSPPNTTNRFFIGDTLGTITIKYENGEEDDVPIILGYTAWWYNGANGSEPFHSDATAKATLTNTLFVKYTGQKHGHANFLALKPRTNKIEKIILKNNKSKEGFPMLTGLTFEALDDETDFTNFPLKGIEPPPEDIAWIDSHSITAKTFFAVFDDSQLDNLRETIYTHAEDFSELAPYSIPANFKGPKINFSGSITAEVITRIYYSSAQDIDDKIDADGTFHTSTKNAAQFGMYTGFGTWYLNHGSYYNDAWSRDAGRVLMEFCELGYETQMWASCDWFNKKLMWYPAQFPSTNINGNPLPGHWVQNANKPAATRVVPMPTGFGNLENDGHGLMMMAQYKGWVADGKTKNYIENSWTNFNEAAEYICWLFDNPTISHAENNRLYSDTEGEITKFSLYCDFPCWLGLLGYAEMADAIGKTAKATRWRNYAARLEDGINNYYPKDDNIYGDIWDAQKAADWRYGHSSLAPVILWADMKDFDMSTMPPAWLARSTNTYNRQIKQCVPEYASGVSMGYGHGFITQGALLLDKMKDASGLIEWLAKLTYFKGYKPYIIPESCEVGATGEWWHRTGDLGNAVQEAENLKSIRLMVGVEDLNPEKLRILPRLTAGFTNMNVEDYLITSKSGGQIKKIFGNINFSRLWDKDVFKISASEKFDSLSVRLGPYGNNVTQVLVEVNNGIPVVTNTFKSGDSRWIWIEGLNSTNEYEIIIQTAIPEPTVFLILDFGFIVYINKIFLSNSGYSCII